MSVICLQKGDSSQGLTSGTNWVGLFLACSSGPKKKKKGGERSGMGGFKDLLFF